MFGEAYTMAVSGSKWVEMTGQSCNGLKVACKIREMAGNSWTLIKIDINREYQSHVHSSEAAALA